MRKGYIYRPQRSWAKVILLRASVILSIGGGWGCLPQCMLGYHQPPEQTPPRADTTPLEQTPPRSRPPGADTPKDQTPPEQTPPQDQTPPWYQTPPGTRHPPGLSTPPRTKYTPLGLSTPPRSRLQHTVNKQPVHILLECILVLTSICHSVHEGWWCTHLLWPFRHPPPPRQTPPGQTDTPLVRHPPGRWPLQRTVRILLECILIQI